MIMHDEKEFWKEIAKLLTQQSPGETEENYETFVRTAGN
jgi:hypothetical protein